VFLNEVDQDTRFEVPRATAAARLDRDAAADLPAMRGVLGSRGQASISLRNR
jgi:hypothetical protein